MKPPRDKPRLKQSDFRRICSQAPTDRTKFYRFYAKRREGTGSTRGPEDLLGLSVSRRVGNAVERNRLKRRFRSIFRQMKGRGPGLEMVVVAKPGARAAPYAELQDAFERSVAAAVVRSRPAPVPKKDRP